MDLVTLRIDGIDAQVPKQWGQLIEQAITKRDESIAKLTKETGESKARTDTLQGELDGTKKKLEAATDPKRLDAAITDRVALQDRARKVLGDEFKFDGKNPREIKEAVIVKVSPEVKLDGKSEEYVQALFENLPTKKLDNEDGPDDDDEDQLAAARRATSGGSGGSRSSRRDAFDYRKPSPPAWQQPLAVHRKD